MTTQQNKLPLSGAALANRKSDIFRQLLQLHRSAPEIRIASCLSCLDLLVALYYGGVLKFDANNPAWSERDRFIASKGHGALALYPILADLGFFDRDLLRSACSSGSMLGAIPHPTIPGIETVNGSLGHGLGVGCGMAIALKERRSSARVFVMVGDAELAEGAVWEAALFAAARRLGNIILLVDHNKKGMLGPTDEIFGNIPLSNRLAGFGWNTLETDGHDVVNLPVVFANLSFDPEGPPSAVILHTVKGKGIPSLESDPICHVKSLSKEEIDSICRQEPC